MLCAQQEVLNQLCFRCVGRDLAPWRVLSRSWRGKSQWDTHIAGPSLPTWPEGSEPLQSAPSRPLHVIPVCKSAVCHKGICPTHQQEIKRRQGGQATWEALMCGAVICTHVSRRQDTKPQASTLIPLPIAVSCLELDGLRELLAVVIRSPLDLGKLQKLSLVSSGPLSNVAAGVLDSWTLGT